MSLPVQTASPGTPGFSRDTGERDLLAAARRAHNAKNRSEKDGRRLPPLAPRRQSLRRVKDSKEELLRTRTRGVSNATLESSTTNNTAPSGRSFTVANVNNGIIYLRPIVRAGNQRSHPLPDPFVFPPQTPPDSATLDSNALSSPNNDYDQSIYGSRATPQTERPPPVTTHQAKTDDDLTQLPLAYFNTSSPPRPTPHVRSRSLSTADDHTINSHSTEPGTFRIVIEKPNHSRPKTADTGTFPLLEVPIPHYRLGTPRFSTQGTAILRSSVYTRASATEDFRSSFLNTQRARHSLLSSRHRSDVYSPVPPNFRTTLDRIALMDRQASSMPSSARVSKIPIGPQLYDAITVNPDDQTVVKFSPTGDILGATPSRLVAHITSPSFLDYELLSDFFLTFRSFLSSRDLVAYLISRLRWAVDRQDDFGRIVRVRTFVALRHWILNYFVDDFVPNYSLRVYFCDLVNALYTDLKARSDGGGGDIKIVGELKKCWRRTCALYWDAEDGIGKDLADDDLLPGGQPGSQISQDEIMQHLPVPSTPPRQAGSSTKSDTAPSNPSDQFASKHMDWAQRSRHTPQNSQSSPYVPSQEYEGNQAPLSPASEHSMQVVSCSIPVRGLGLNKAEPANELPLYPHPVPHPAPARFAASPQQVTSAKKSNRPAHAHKRSGSFSDALRDHRAPLSIPKNAAPDAAISAVSNMPGTLVRGGIFQPSSPYIDVKNGGLRHTRSHLDLEPIDTSSGDFHMRPGHATNPGMKKLIGSVRRALSSRQYSPSSPHLPHSPYQHHASSSRSSNPATVSIVSGGVHKRRATRPRPQVRVDVLASKVGESFKEAVQEQLRNEQQRQSTVQPELSAFEFEFEPGTTSPPGDGKAREQDPRIYSNITSGSKSIVIMDDTGAPPLPVMSGALPAPVDAESVQTVIEQKNETVDEPPTEEDSDAPTVDLSERPSSAALPERNASLDWRQTARSSIQRSFSTKRRSASEGREHMHSFRRRGSKKGSMSRPASLRRHASHNSGLGRKHSPSIATFQTMSSDNDPFFLDRHPHEQDAAGPARQLRRRPGGDLRAVDNVQDLEQQIQRPHSTGSISNQTHSIANSVVLRSDRYDPQNERDDHNEDSQPPEPPKKAISLVATHSSQPNLRPSFEAEVAKLAALPDDTDDDGGIESALMKLEGRYEKKSPSLPSPASPAFYEPAKSSASSHTSSVPSDQHSSHTETHAKSDDTLHRPLAPPESEVQDMYRLSGENFNKRLPNVQSSIESEDSYSSVPLLDRGISGITDAQASDAMHSMASSAKPAPLNVNSPPSLADGDATPRLGSPNSSVEYITETESMKRIPRNGTRPQSSIARESFLLDDDEDLSDMDEAGSGGRPHSDDTSHGVRSFFDDEPATIDEEQEDGLPTHPMRHPPTPPLTANRLKDSPPPVDTTIFDRGLPTPGLTPTSRLNNQSFGQHLNHPSSPPMEPAVELQELKSTDTANPPAHLPFIMAYDSEVLAQQFTIVEKDALDEIDWKELIELRWKQSSPQIRDWVQYLRTQEARGVDVVIARFNLVVKWAVSECLLTENIEERARCIVKYIHIASHARRLRNYATMYQITIALLSADVSRLKRTWSMIPAAEMQTMRELEALVQPLKNFHNLRNEMETSCVENGCIPFIGIYTRDLIYNAQKPPFLDAPPVDGERLVNFERHHTAAMIVKSLLRLLEASSKYTFQPEPNIISKCLWLAALGDEELTALSRKYE
ncbi:ras GEF [Aaosphaeria arxii CBS 175.79]|uniref:Ras GEF n=1 Tax=Aaosphaeria arxii CBS 175.79 TaxID=1450172 RepID=A0A6A5XIM9_9PLEO|nr:ras GEF [Aaosphaeria arxii CBS 175.79]KAF2012164.1 ras GEF [Aaosphaeria arxii CBS 175.79]